jgi:hypothetical protein
MNLSFRPTQPKDLKECLPLAKDIPFFTKAEYPRLIAFWTELLKDRMMYSAVVEDHGRPVGQRILAFRMHLFTFLSSTIPNLNLYTNGVWSNTASPVKKFHILHKFRQEFFG